MAVDAEGGAPAEGELDASMEPQPDCPICLEPIDQLQKLPCGHNLCGSCLQRYVKIFHEQHEQNAGTSEHSYDLDNPPPAGLACPCCRTPIDESALVNHSPLPASEAVDTSKTDGEPILPPRPFSAMEVEPTVSPSGAEVPGGSSAEAVRPMIRTHPERVSGFKYALSLRSPSPGFPPRQCRLPLLYWQAVECGGPALPASGTGSFAMDVEPLAPATIGNGVEVKESLLEDAGRGLFAQRKLARRDLITKYAGKKLEDKFAAAQCDPQTHIVHVSTAFNKEIGNDVYIDGDREPVEGSGGGSFANHKQQKHHCNAEFALVDGDVFLRATREIEEGEEIYVHCGTDLDVMMGRKRRSITSDVDGRRCITTEVIPVDASDGASSADVHLPVESPAKATQELTAALAALRVCTSTTAAVAKEAADAGKALDLTRTAMKGQLKAVQQAALGPLEAQQREKAAAREASLAAEAATRQEAERAADALRTDWEQWESLHTRGYVVEAQERHGIHVDTRTTPTSMKFEPIFNGGDPAVGESSHRLQGRTHRQSGKVAEEIKSFERQSNELLDRRGWRRTACRDGREAFKKAKDTYVLRAVADCKDAMVFVKPGERARFGCTNGKCKRRCDRQRFHGDSAPPNAYHDEQVWAQWCRDERNPSRIAADETVPPLPAWADVPLVMLMATQDNTPFHVRPFDMGGEEVKLILNAGDLIIFRGIRRSKSRMPKCCTYIAHHFCCFGQAISRTPGPSSARTTCASTSTSTAPSSRARRGEPSQSRPRAHTAREASRLRCACPPVSEIV